MSTKKDTLLTQITNKVKALFAETPEDEKKDETEMAEAVVKDTGITVRAEAWEVGNVVTTTTEEGDEIAIPEGSYELEDGTVLVVDEMGIITQVVAVEVEVDAEDEDEKKKEEMSYVTKVEFTTAMSEMLKALERVSTKLSAVPKEKTSEKIEAENKLLKTRLAEKRKAISDKTATEKKDILPANFGKTDRGHRSGTKDAVAKKFRDFDFKMERSTEKIEL